MPQPNPRTPASAPGSAKRWQPPTVEELQQRMPGYVILSLLGRGGMGAVYRGTQMNLDRPVAIKILPPGIDVDDDANYVERFKNEARAMAKLSHPGIVCVYDSGETADGLLFIVMEFVEGTDVQKMVSTQGRLHSEHALAITAHVSDALHYAHERGIVHRDIKPANIMVGYDGVVKVADFGLAKMSRAGESGLTRSGMAMGTLHYMAPEALMLGSSVDHRADVYAVGVMLYFMLTGKLPHGMFELPSLQVAGLDPRFDGIITQALRDDRDIRYQSAADLRRDLDGLQTQAITQVVVPSSTPATTESEPSERHAPSPGGHYYRPPGADVVVRVERRGSPLLWLAMLVMSGIASWLWLRSEANHKEDPGSTPSAAASTEATVPSAPATTIVPAGETTATTATPTQSANGPWLNWLLTDMSKYTFTLGSASDFTPVQGGAGAIRAFKVTSPVTFLSGSSFQNFAVRIRFTTSAETKSLPEFVVRSNGDSFYVGCQPSPTEMRWICHFEGNGKKASKELARVIWQADTPVHKPIELEIHVVGDRFSLMQDGRFVFGGTDSRYPSGKIGLHLDAGTVIDKFDVKMLSSEVSPGSQAPEAAPTTDVVLSDMKPGIWHDLLGGQLRDANSLVKEPAAGGSGSQYRATGTVLANSLGEYQDCIIRGRFSGKWATPPMLITRHRDERNQDVQNQGVSSMQHICAGWYGYEARLGLHTKTSLKPVAVKDQEAPLSRDKPFEMELRAVGNQFTLLKDGTVVLEGSTADCPAGRVGLHVFANTIIEKLEVMPLVSDTAVAVPAGSVVRSTAAAPLPNPRHSLARGVWHDLFGSTLITTAGLTPEAGGGFRATSTTTSTATPVFTDCVLRARFAPGNWNGAPQLITRREAESTTVPKYISAACFDSKAFLRSHLAGGGFDVFSTATMDSPLLRDQAFTLELQAVGDHFIYRRDGKELVSGTISGYPTGHVGFRLELGTVIQSLQVMPLDGLSPEAQQAALASDKHASSATASAPASAISATPAGPAPLITDTQRMQLVVDADFAQQQPAFRDSKTDRLEMKWQDQSYRMTALNKAIWWPGVPTMQRLQLADFVCEAEFRMPHTANGKWGIGMSAPNRMPWIGVGMDAQGRAEVYRYDERAIVPYTATTASPAGADAWNTLRMEVVGSRLRVWVNGSHVMDADTTGIPTPYGLNLFTATPEPGLEVWFRRLRVWQPASAAAPVAAASTTTPPAPAPTMPVTSTAPTAPAVPNLILHQTFDAPLPGLDGKSAKVVDGELVLDGDYNKLYPSRPALSFACRDFDDEKFTIAARLRHERSEDVLFVGGGSTRWLALAARPSGSLELSLHNGGHIVRIHKSNVPLKKSFVLAVSGNLKTGPVDVYVDGQLVKSVPVPADHSPTSKSDKELVLVNYGNAETLRGAVDELVAFNRMLTPVEIAVLLRGPGSLVPPAAAPALASATTTSPPPAAASSDWIDKQGRKIQAEFVRLERDRVIIRTLDKQEHPVPLNSLSAESVNLARQLAAAAPPASAAAAAVSPTTAPAPAATGFTNTLGMSFVAVPSTQVLFCVHETRFSDFAQFAASAPSTTTYSQWKNQTYAGYALKGSSETHPVVNVTTKNAQDFCAWLSQKEGRKYRLPTEKEWTQAAAAGSKAAARPLFPWGDVWPPPARRGNYCDESYHRLLRPGDPYLVGYDDGYPTTAPVKSYPANALGIYDLGGNVWEWIVTDETAANAQDDAAKFLQRGASFLHNDREMLLSAKRIENSYGSADDRGFRIVLEAK